MIYIFLPPILLLLAFIGYAKTTGNWQKFFMVIGALIDFVVNITYFSIIFWDIPKEYLLTKRVERLKFNLGWRGKLALLICKLLNYIMPSHCGD